MMLKVSKATGNSHAQQGIENPCVQLKIHGSRAGRVVEYGVLDALDSMFLLHCNTGGRK
jgi:hypothetical protein